MSEQLKLFEFDNSISENSLTRRQLATYNLIKNNSIIYKTTSQREIVDNYSKEFEKDGYVWNNNPRVHDHCSMIWQDINKINSDYSIHEIIIWDDNYNYKLADSVKEVEEFCQRLYWTKAMAKLWRYGNLMRKVKRTGQYNMFSSEGDERSFWQTFLTNHVEDFIKMSKEEINDEESYSE